jgi:hypothetical protein
MKKELTFSFELTDEQIDKDEPVFSAFGITEGRSAFLISFFENRCKQLMANAGWGIIDDLKEFCLFLEGNDLSGQDIAFLTFTGWRAARMTTEICVETVKQLTGKGALHG